MPANGTKGTKLADFSGFSYSLEIRESGRAGCVCGDKTQARRVYIRSIDQVDVISLVEVGEYAPEFTLQADDGRHVMLSDYRGKKVILYFYPKDGTPGCTTEAKEFRDHVKAFEEENAVILGVSKDSVKSHKRFKQKHALPFTLLSDPEGRVLDLYGVWKKKSLYGRTFMGTERTTFLIDEDGVVERAYRKVKAKGHAEMCLLDLKSKP
jgi:peroxiredoxin Q/BCP